MAFSYEGIVRSYIKIENLKVRAVETHKKHAMEVVIDKMDEGRVANFIPIKIKKTYFRLIVQNKGLGKDISLVQMEKNGQDGLEKA